jgi:hypothetical protein
VDVIFPLMSRFLAGESPHTPDYDFAGVAAALKGQGVKCVGEDYDVFIRKSAEQALLSAYAGAPGSPRAADSLVKEENIVSLLELGISREDAIHALSTESSVDAAASSAMSKILNEDRVAPPPAGTRPEKWDIILHREVYGAGMPAPTATALELRVLLHHEGYILVDALFPQVRSSFGDDAASVAVKSETLKSKILFAEQWCRHYVCFRAIVSLDCRYAVLQATQQEGRFIETVVDQ